MQQMQQLYWGVNGTLISIFHIEIWKVEFAGGFQFSYSCKTSENMRKSFSLQNFQCRKS